MDGGDVYVVGEIKNRTEVLEGQAVGVNTYSCQWGFQQRLHWRSSQSNPKPVGTTLFYQGENTTNEYPTNVGTGFGLEAYITEGSNSEGKIDYSYTTQTQTGDLENHAVENNPDTSQIPPGTDPWKHFPSLGSAQIRHPNANRVFHLS